MTGSSIRALNRIGGFYIVREDEEARAVGADLGQREPVQHGAHGVLADPEMHIAAARRVGFEVAGALEQEFKSSSTEKDRQPRQSAMGDVMRSR